MIGFSQFVETNTANIVEQRIKLFLASYFILNPTFGNIFKSEILPDKIKDAFRNILFIEFKTSLKDAKIHEEYLICSLFTEQTNYDFTTKSEELIVQEANSSFELAFTKVLDNYFQDKSEVPSGYLFEYPEGDSLFDIYFILNGIRDYFTFDSLKFWEENENIPIAAQNEILDNTLKSLINFNEED